MRARHRHFNPAHAGAAMALDSRYLSGTNATGVSSWPNRANSTNNAEQSTPSNEPLFTTNSLSGSAGVEFDGTSDYLFWPTAIQMRFGVAVFKAGGSQTQYASMWGTADDAGSNLQHLFGTLDRWVNIGFSDARWTGATWRKNGTVFTGTDIDTVTLNAEVVSVLLTDNLGFPIKQLRDRSFTTRVINGSLYQYQIFTAEPSAPLIKRLQFSAAYSFKISCN